MMKSPPLRIAALLFLSLSWVGTVGFGQSLSIATFQVDVSPPAGSPLCHGGLPPVVRVVDPLTARGIILLTEREPIVLCAVDWVGLGNEGYEVWRRALAEAAGTGTDRVVVHAVHQHDAPACDFALEKVLAAHGLSGAAFDVAFARATIARVATAVGEAIRRPRQVTHIGLGQAKVERVASNRRILGPDGKVQYFRRSFCTDPIMIAAPEGLIDPYLRVISLWDGDEPVAALMYYATHPQSSYGRGAVSADLAGLARALRELELPTTAHIYFTGAGGNVAAGKYNDGSLPRRLELAGRLADGMRRAWEATEKSPIAAADVDWKVRPVRLPLREGWTEKQFISVLADPKANRIERIRAARTLAWIERCHRGDRIDLTCLRLGKAQILSLPGEPFVEYQLAAQKMEPDGFVCVAGYTDYGPGYIGTTIAYEQGGYETGAVSRVDASVEVLLLSAMRELLAASPVAAR